MRGITTRVRWQFVVGGALLIVAARMALWFGSAYRFQDLAVYRAGAEAMLQGRSPYEIVSRGLRFTYPPFAAVSFVPLAALPWGAALTGWAVLTLLGYAVLVLAVARHLRLGPREVLVVGVAGLGCVPVLRTLQLGQINLVLAGLVALDLWILPPGNRFRGVGLGVAAGIKVVPAAFLLCLVLARDWIALRRAVLTILGTGALAAAIAPHATWTYATSLLFDTSRAGGGRYPDNQSLVGVLARLLQNDHPPFTLTLPLQLGALWLGYRAARSAASAGDELRVVLAIAFGALLASPISWSHHWVWLVPLLMLLYAERRRLAFAAVGVVALLAPLSLSSLGWLAAAPRPVTLVTTTLYPAVGMSWLVIGSRRARGRHTPSGYPANRPNESGDSDGHLHRHRAGLRRQQGCAAESIAAHRGPGSGAAPDGRERHLLHRRADPDHGGHQGPGRPRPQPAR